MPIFLVKKWQSGTDAHGDDFDWKHQDLIIEAKSQESLEKALALVGRPEIYAREYLRLRFIGEYSGDSKSVTLREFLGWYPDALARFTEQILDS